MIILERLRPRSLRFLGNNKRLCLFRAELFHSPIGSVMKHAFMIAIIMGGSAVTAAETAPREKLPEPWTGSMDWTSIESTKPHHGKKYVRIDAWTKEPGYAWLASERLPAKPGAAYSISAWVRSQANTEIEDFLAIRWHESNKYIDQEPSVIPADASNWTEVTGTSVCPDNATHVDVALFVRSKRGKVWLDNVSLKVDGTDTELLKNGSFEDGSQSADKQSTVNPAKLDDIEPHLDVEFARYGDSSLKLDLFRPKNQSRRLPAVVGIHAGAWQRGNKKNFRKPCLALASRGFVTVSINYRLSDEASFPAQIEDCKAAVRWLRASADKYGIDENRIGAIGHSAGGHLAALLATTGGVSELEGDGGNPSQSSDVQAAVAIGGQTDLLNDHVRKESATERGEFWRKFLGGSQVEKTDLYRLASPIHHFDNDDPPLYLITGERDELVTRGDEIRKKLEQNRIPTGLTIIESAPHAFFENSEWFDQAMEASANFFVLHLGDTRDE
jgi:pectinesterase